MQWDADLTAAITGPAQAEAPSEVPASDAMYEYCGRSFARLISRGMFALFALRTANRLEESSPKRSQLSRAEADVRALLARIRQRQYPESIPVLASYWLKTVYASGYTLRQWNELNPLLKPT